MIDTHCHLDKNDYDNIEIIIKKMDRNIIIASGVDKESNQNVLFLCSKYSNVYGTLGFHPEFVDRFNDGEYKFIEKNLSNPKIVGVGEIGLDYYYSKDNSKKQKDVFIKLIDLAKKYNKPVVIHSREACNDTYNILASSNYKRFVLHCYSYSEEMAHRFIDLGCMLGIGGVVTFKNATKLVETVKNVDINYLLLETDSPFLTPVPYRGEKNEPYNIIYVASKIAEIKNLSKEEVLKITTSNACRQFDLRVKL